MTENLKLQLKGFDALKERASADYSQLGGGK